MTGEPWSELIESKDDRGFPSVTLACAHGSVRLQDARNAIGKDGLDALTRARYDQLDQQFTDEEMSPRSKAIVVLRSILAALLEDTYGCRDGWAPYEIEEA